MSPSKHFKHAAVRLGVHFEPSRRRIVVPSDRVLFPLNITRLTLNGDYQLIVVLRVTRTETEISAHIAPSNVWSHSLDLSSQDISNKAKVLTRLYLRIGRRLGKGIRF